MIATELKTGKVFKEGNTPYLVLKYEHTKVARGGATVKVRARNLLTGAVMEKGYLGSSRVEDADISKSDAQYLYKDKSNYVFMNPKTYEQFFVSEDVVGDAAMFLQEGCKVMIMYFEGNPVSLELPKSVVFEVTYTEPGYRGNTATNTYKDATLSNGTVIKAPLFIKIGDMLKINTETGTYVSKA